MANEINTTDVKLVTNCDRLTVPIESCIFTYRSAQVMVDRDLATLYSVDTKVLNQAVKRNIERFPERFRFQLTDDEKNELVANCDRLQSLKHSSVNPYVFTEQGVAMLSTVLRSDTAVQMSIKIMDAFVAMRQFLTNNAVVFHRLESVEQHLIESDLHQKESDMRIDELFKKMELQGVKPKQGVFFQGEMFDAYVLFENLLMKATREIVLIDNYVDLTILERLTKKQPGVNVKIYTHPRTSLTQLDVTTFNSQYPHLELHTTTRMHDRYLIIDGVNLYHIGASLKDLGKKCFAFNKMDDASVLISEILRNL